MGGFMDLFIEWKRSMVARKRVSAKNLYYGYVGIVQSNYNGDNYIVYDEKFVIVRECKKGDKVFYKDVVEKGKVYHSVDDFSLSAGSVVFHSEESLNEYLLPNEMYLGEVTYGRLIDLYYELNEENMSYKGKENMSKVLQFKRKNN